MQMTHSLSTDSILRKTIRRVALAILALVLALAGGQARLEARRTDFSAALSKTGFLNRGGLNAAPGKALLQSAAASRPATPSSAATTMGGCAMASFDSAVSFGVIGSPDSVAVGDFNLDGKPDLAVANGEGFVSVLLGNGLGNFGAAGTFSAGAYPIAVAVGDFNQDGKSDLVVANFNSNNVSVLLGNGLGGFGAAVNFAVGTNPIAVAVGDFNSDGKLDLAVANQNSGNVSVLLGDGLGGFGAAANFSTGASPFSVAVGDFNLDGLPDLAVANSSSNNVSVLPGNGLGSFGAAANFSTGANPRSVAMGDFNQDGKPDLVVANFNSNNVSVLLGNGLGGFGAAVNFAVGANPVAVAVGDFNSDGHLDLAVANNLPSLSALLGDGLGGFGAVASFGAGLLPSLAVGDFNQDGKPDLAVTNNLSHTVSVLLNNCPAGLQFYPLPRPIRLFDTRGPIAGFPACAYLNQPLQGGGEFARQARITCDGITIPPEAQAIVGNATVVSPSGDGWIILWPDGETRPPASNLNYVAGQTVPNAFTLRLGTNGQFRVFSRATTDFIVDITGYFAPPQPAGLYYHPLPRPIRLFDTRGPIAGFPACEYLNQRLTGGAELAKQARISCDGISIPTDAQAIVGNATVVTPSGSGWITLWPDGELRPPAANLNYVAGQIVPNAFALRLGANGQFRVYSFASTDFIIDIAGYYSSSPSDANGAGLLYSPLTRPIRLFDTRGPIPGYPACEYLSQPLAGGVEFVKQARITCDSQTIPASARAIVANATVVFPSADGYAIIWPDGQVRPPASNLNYVAGQIVPNAFTVGLGSTGQFRIYPLANMDFLVDIAGFYAP